jgi:VWFA-related protein
MSSIQTASFPEISFSTTVTMEGVPVSGLTAKDFLISEDDAQVRNFRITMKGLPVDVALVLDTSGSVKNFLREIKKGASMFVDSLKDSDQALVIEFSDDVLLSQKLTYDKAVLKSSIDDLRARGGTKLYDAIARGVNEIRSGRGIVVVMTDGRDIRKASDTDQYSDTRLEDLLNTVKKKKVPIFSIGVGNDIDIEGLSALGKISGGKFFQTMDPAGITEMYRQISRLINCHYLITYNTPKPVNEGKWRTVKIVEKIGSATAEGKYQIPLPPEMTAKTEPIDTLRIYELGGSHINITTHDKNYLEGELKVLNQDILLDSLDTVLTGKTFSIYDRTRTDSSTRSDFNEGKGTGARTFKLINGQKFFFTDDGSSLCEYNLKVPAGCTLELYFPHSNVTIGSGTGKLVLYRLVPGSVKIESASNPVIFNRGTGSITVNWIEGNATLVADGPGGIDVMGGNVQFLNAGTYGVGDIHFGGSSVDSRIWVGGVGSIGISELQHKPVMMVDDGVGSINIGKNIGNQWEPQAIETLADPTAWVKVPAVIPYPGNSIFTLKSGDLIDSKGYGGIDYSPAGPSNTSNVDYSSNSSKYNDYQSPQSVDNESVINDLKNSDSHGTNYDFETPDIDMDINSDKDRDTDSDAEYDTESDSDSDSDTDTDSDSITDDN